MAEKKKKTGRLKAARESRKQGTGKAKIKRDPSALVYSYSPEPRGYASYFATYKSFGFAHILLLLQSIHSYRQSS